MTITQKIAALVTLLTLVVGLSSCAFLNGLTGSGANDEAMHTHSFTNWKVTKNASCTENGAIEGECSCGEKTTDTLSALGHTYANGVCSICGASENKPIASTGFTFKVYEEPDFGAMASITGIGECNDSELILPETTPDGIVVRMIEANAFANCTEITKVTIPACYWTFDHTAFDNCTSLEEVIFEGCYTAIQLLIWDDTLFGGCTSLSKITVKEDAPTENDNVLWGFVFSEEDSAKLKSINGDLYYEITEEEGITLILLKVANTKTKYVFPDNCLWDNYHAFFACTQLTEIVIHKDLTRIRGFDLKDLNVTDIYYEGTEEQWNSMYKGPDSPYPEYVRFFEEVNVHFNYVD